MASIIQNIFEFLLGRRLLWKFSRRLYLQARREGSLDIETNGERALQTALARRSALTGKGLRIYDVGANHGQWSRSMINEIRNAGAPRAHMTLFEPIPAIRPSLDRLKEESAEVVDLEVVPMAVSSEPGRAQMLFGEVGAGNHHLAGDALQDPGERIDVEITTLDVFHDQAGDGLVDMVKVDAEGFDPRVLEGMQALLAAGLVGVIQIEYGVLFVRSRAYLFDVFELAAKYGYKVALLTARGFEVHPAWHPDLERFYLSPYVLLRDDCVDVMPARVVTYGDDNAHE